MNKRTPNPKSQIINPKSLLHVSRREKAAEFEVRFPAQPYPQGTQAALEALDAVEALEEQLSFFRPESELSRINLLAADQPVEVTPPLFELLALAVRLYEETGGAYDITSAPLWEAWGFARRAGEIPADAQLAQARQCVGGHLLELDPQRRTIRYRKPGVRINLGSIGKGYAVDVCGQRLSAQGVHDFLVHGGKSSVLASGEQPYDPPEQGSTEPAPWEIGIPHPRQPGRRLAIVRLRDRALGTSGGQFQTFRHHGHRYGHILDPRSGWPAEGILSATVMADTAAMADALSTAFYVMGPEPALDYCRTHPKIGAVLTTPDQHGGGVAIHTAGLTSQ